MLTVLLVSVSTMAEPDHPKQTIRELTRMPKDTADAERLRLWIPLEHTTSCRVVIDVLGRRGQPIRNLVNRLMKNGYFNFYWDKRDTQGNLVAPGTYTVRVRDCGNEYYRTVEVAYRLWEAETDLNFSNSRGTPELIYRCTVDSLPITIKLTTATGTEVATLMADSAFATGRYRLPVETSIRLANGKYLARLFVDDEFVREVEFWYRP